MLSTYRSLQESSGPSVEPVSLADAKTHLHVTHSKEDDLITSMIEVARREVQRVTARQLINATWVMRMDSFPSGSGDIYLPRAPLSSVTTVAYNDANGDAQTMTVTTEYLVDVYTVPGRIYLAPNGAWPSTYGEPNDVTVTFVAGYGSQATDVPENYIHAIKLMVGHLYLYRERFAAGETVTELPTYGDLFYDEQIEYTF